MSASLLSFVLALVAAGANVVGGGIVTSHRWALTTLRYFIALGAGFMLGTVFLEMVPESLNLLETAPVWILVGYLLVHTFEHTFASHLHFGEETHHEEMVNPAVGIEIRQVYGQSSSAVRKLEVEDSLNISLEFEDGALGSVMASDATPSPWSYEAATHENPHYFHTDENCYHFLGTLGSLAFPRMELWRHADADQMGWQYPLEKRRRNVARADPLKSQLEHFCRVVRNREKTLVDGWDATRSLAVALAVLESIQSRVPVVLPVS